MITQKVVITSDSSKINELIESGWVVKTVVAQHIATPTGTSNYGH
jgi:hypothetical protein